MPRYREENSSDHRKCPYCGYTHHVEGEDYSEEDREEECSECGEKYWAAEVFEVTHFSRPDCALNGREHDWFEYVGHGQVLHRRCRECGKFSST